MEYNLTSIYNDKEFENLKNSFKLSKKIYCFINRLKCDNLTFEREFQDLDLEYKKLNEYCYLFKACGKSILSSMQTFNEFKFYMQSYASCLCALNLGVRAGQGVLDMYAAPGGKNINLASFMQNEGHLACNEASKDRFFTLQKNLKNYGVRARVFMKDGKNIGNLCPLKFDKILLDASCSILTKMGLELEKSSEEIKNIVKLQKKLLHSALKALEVGGKLVYSTCTFTKEKNGEMIENALESDFDIELLDINLENALVKNGRSSEFETVSRCKRILPCEEYDGFLITKLRKN